MGITPFLLKTRPILRDQNGCFVSIPYSDNSPLPSNIYDCLIGNLLGDGSLRYTHKDKEGKAKQNTNALYVMTLKSFEYISHLFNIYSPICTSASIRPWPNPKTGKPASQYTFSTRSLPQLSKLHSQW